MEHVHSSVFLNIVSPERSRSGPSLDPSPAIPDLMDSLTSSFHDHTYSGQPPLSPGVGNGAPNPWQVDLIKWFQLNLQHARVPSYELFPKIKGSALGLVQEPWHYKGKIMGLLPHQIALHLPDPRAAKVAPKSLNITFLPQLSTPDLAVAVWNTSSQNVYLQQILLISWYWPIQDPFPESMVALFRYIESHHLEFIIGMDSNAHSTLWGNSVNNHRGDLLEEFIMSHQIHILNTPGPPTFESQVGSSYIDITRSSSLLIDRTRNWTSARSLASVITS